MFTIFVPKLLNLHIHLHFVCNYQLTNNIDESCIREV